MAQHVLKQIIVNEFKCITIVIITIMIITVIIILILILMITILIIITASKWNELKKTWIILG